MAKENQLMDFNGKIYNPSTPANFKNEVIKMEKSCYYDFSFNNEEGITTSLSFVVPSDCTIQTFCDMCRKFALALGYTEETVDKYLGEYYDEAFIEYV